MTDHRAAAGGVWNRAGRRSGGNRPARIVVPRLTRSGVEDALGLLDAIAGWPENDWQGLKYHAMAIAGQMRAAAPAPPAEGWSRVVLRLEKLTRTFVARGEVTVEYVTDRDEGAVDAFIDGLSKEFAVRKE